MQRQYFGSKLNRPELIAGPEWAVELIACCHLLRLAIAQTGMQGWDRPPLLSEAVIPGILGTSKNRFIYSGVRDRIPNIQFPSLFKIGMPI